MERELLQKIKNLIEEEEAKLRREAEEGVQEELTDVYRGSRYLNKGKMIAFHPHARENWCGSHRHDYVELAYVLQGSCTHIVEGKRLTIKKGELLFLSQRAHHEIPPAGEDDLMINIIIQPEFFEKIFLIIGEEETPLHRFLLDCLCKRRWEVSYLHFKVENERFIQNLMENMLETLIRDVPNKHNVLQITMGLLFLHLMNYTDSLASVQERDKMAVQALQYIETNYCEGSLQELAKLLSYDFHSLSRDIRQKTGKTYTQLVQEKRLSQACFYLRNTDMSVEEISRKVGYENISFFYRLFRSRYGASPRRYRHEK